MTTRTINERNVEALHDLLNECPEIQVDYEVLRDAAVWLTARGVLVPHVLVSADLFRLSPRFKDHDVAGTGTLRAINGEGVRLTLEQIARGEP